MESVNVATRFWVPSVFGHAVVPSTIAGVFVATVLLLATVLSLDGMVLSMMKSVELVVVAAESFPPVAQDTAKSARTIAGMPSPKINPRLVSLLRCCLRMRS